MGRLLVLAALVVLAGCAHSAEESSTAGKGVTVDRLFDHDGVTVYRFYDSGRYHYYAVPRTGPASMSTAWQQCVHTGKTTTCHEERDETQTVALR